MIPAKMNFTLYRGDYRKFTVTATDATGQPINLTGYTAKARNLAPNTTNISVIASWKCTIPLPASGAVQCELLSEEAEHITGDTVWEFKLYDPSGEPQTYLVGKATLMFGAK